MSAIKNICKDNFKNAYWARFFKKRDGGYTVDVPDMPGCSTWGSNMEEAYQRLVGEAIPLWLEDQPWPTARKSDEILSLPHEAKYQPSLLIRVTIDEVSGLLLAAWPIKSMDTEYDRRRHN